MTCEFICEIVGAIFLYENAIIWQLSCEIFSLPDSPYPATTGTPTAWISAYSALTVRRSYFGRRASAFKACLSAPWKSVSLFACSPCRHFSGHQHHRAATWPPCCTTTP